MHAFFPSQPQIEGGDNQDAAMITYTFVDALSSIDLGLGDGGALDGALPPLGWDLDGVITCPGNPSCVQRVDTKVNCDDSEGRDHTGLELFRQLGPIAVAGIGAANHGMQIGEFGLIIQVKGYTGQPNAANLTVSIFASSGVLGTGDGGVQLNHDGNDKWTVDPRYLKGVPATGVDCGGSGIECVAVYASTSAYVSHGALVAAFPSDVPITFGGRAHRRRGHDPQPDGPRRNHRAGADRWQRHELAHRQWNALWPLGLDEPSWQHGDDPGSHK